MPLNQLLNVGEVARLLGISPHTVYSWTAKGRLPVVKVGGRTMFDPSEIQRWLADRSVRERPERAVGTRGASSTA
ncbi:MAG: helix-turn-helix domain-containing protein [Thermoanaerobaculia bacterium]